MAFTVQQKYTILKYLCWPLKTIDPTSLSYSKIVTDRLDTFPSDAEAMVTDLIAKMVALDARITTGTTRAGVKQIDDIHFFGNDGGSSEIDQLRTEKNKLAKELSMLLDIKSLCGGSSMGNICV